MKHTLNTGKVITIPDEEITKGIELLGLSRDESIQMYLDDNGFTVNDEQAELNDIASLVKIEHGAKEVKARKKPAAPRTYVNSDEKTMVYERIKECVQTIANDNGGSAEVLKDGKLLLLKLPTTNRPIKIDIIQARPPKS
jgi:hypothetical protein